jgi:multidrug efflux pump subunit AcrA (membrane-fusion protein)
MRRGWIVAAGALGFALLGAGAALGVARVRPAGEPPLPTARVQRGDLTVRTWTTGELRAARSIVVTAPQVGGALRIVEIVHAGQPVRKGDVIVRFDAGEQEHARDQARMDLEQAEQELTKLRADAEVQAAADDVALLKARFAVRRAELDVGANEIRGAIEAKKIELTLEEAKRGLEQLEQDVTSRGGASRAALAVAEEKRTKARLSMQAAERNIEAMTIASPVDGLASVRENQDAAGGFFFTGMTLPEYRPGDTVSAGRLLGQVLELGRMEILAKVTESDRANLSPGLDADVRVHALSRRAFRARIRTVAGLAARRVFENDAIRRFDVVFDLDGDDPSLKPGASVDVIVTASVVRDALYIPRQAVFEKNGRPVTYVRAAAGGFEPRDAKIRLRTDSHAVIEHLDAGAEVALVDPDQPAAGDVPPASAGPAMGARIK